jgi:hypothetical protein
LPRTSERRFRGSREGPETSLSLLVCHLLPGRPFGSRPGQTTCAKIIVAVVNGELDRIGQMLARLLEVLEEALEAPAIRAGRS